MSFCNPFRHIFTSFTRIRSGSTHGEREEIGTDDSPAAEVPDITKTIAHAPDGFATYRIDCSSEEEVKVVLACLETISQELGDVIPGMALPAIDDKHEFITFVHANRDLNIDVDKLNRSLRGKTTARLGPPGIKGLGIPLLNNEDDTFQYEAIATSTHGSPNFTDLSKFLREKRLLKDGVTSEETQWTWNGDKNDLEYTTIFSSPVPLHVAAVNQWMKHSDKRTVVREVPEQSTSAAS